MAEKILTLYIIKKKIQVNLTILTDLIYTSFILSGFLPTRLQAELIVSLICFILAAIFVIKQESKIKLRIQSVGNQGFTKNISPAGFLPA